MSVEPGSGSTLMGYAGLTSRNDLQNHTDADLHYKSIEEIEKYYYHIQKKIFYHLKSPRYY